MATIIDINETKQPHAPRFTEEQKEAWQKAKALLKSGMTNTRALHIAMSELRKENGRKHKGPIETEPKRDGKLTEYKAKLVSSQMAARVAQWKAYLRDPESQKLFIIVRNDLETSQKAVQASHAAAQFQKEHPFAPWINGTLILLTVDVSSSNYKRYTGRGIDPFEEFYNYYYFANYRTLWREPDQGDRVTAMAILADFQNDRIGKVQGTKLL